MPDAPLDISQLALDRSPNAATNAATTLKPRRKRWLTRYVLPAGILLGFLALLAAAAGRSWLPQRSVTVVPVIVQRGEVQQAGATLFQSPGWIEPRPTAISVPALAPGVIEELLVVAGQAVVRGEPIAKLIAIDAELNYEQAANSLAIREGELNRVRAELDAAKIRRNNPLHLKAELADANSLLSKSRTELEKLPFLIEAAAAKVDYARRSLEGKQAAKGAISGNVVARAVSDFAAATAELEELRQRQPNLQREVDAFSEKVNVSRQQIELLVDETRQVREAEAKVQSAEALRAEARLELRQAKLKLERNVIRAPMDGRVMTLVAAPGTRVMGLDKNANHSSSTVVEMYDPARLQVRVDVRLENVPMVVRGQSVEIETASSRDVIQGRVLQATSSANIQKNTLEVKVELIDPPPTVSPEMLVTATFFAPEIANTNSEPTETERLFVPRQLVLSDEAGSFVWIVDAKELAQRRNVEVGAATPQGLTEIKSGLRVTDKLIASDIDGLNSGSPVYVTGDDKTIGMK